MKLCLGLREWSFGIRVRIGLFHPELQVAFGPADVEIHPIGLIGLVAASLDRTVHLRSRAAGSAYVLPTLPVCPQLQEANHDYFKQNITHRIHLANVGLIRIRIHQARLFRGIRHPQQRAMKKNVSIVVLALLFVCYGVPTVELNNGAIFYFCPVCFDEA